MIEILKSRLEDALKEATKGTSIYTFAAIVCLASFIHLNQSPSGDTLSSILNIEISNLIGENSLFLKITIKEIFLAAITYKITTKILNILKSEYFDFLYLTILKQYISKLKIATHTKTTKKSEIETTNDYRNLSNSYNFISIIMISITTTLFHDNSICMGTLFSLLTIFQIFWGIHKSAKYLISDLLPVIIAATPEITAEALDKIFSNLK